MSKRLRVADTTRINLDRIRNREVTKAEVEEIVHRALDDLYRNRPSIFVSTRLTGQTEWNLVHHLAPEIHKFIRFLTCDTDVTKAIQGQGGGRPRPDIIYHIVDSTEYDFLVVEAKKNRSQDIIEGEKQKIIDYWFPAPLRYQFGAVINFKRSK